MKPPILQVIVVVFVSIAPLASAQLLSYDFEESGGIFRNEGSLSGELSSFSGAVRGSEKSGVGGHGCALDLTASSQMGGAGGAYLSSTRAGFPAQASLTATGWFKIPEGNPILKDLPVAFIRDSTGGESSSGFLIKAESDGRLALVIGNGGVALSIRSEKRAFPEEEGQWVFYAVSWNGQTGDWAWYVGSESQHVRKAGSGSGKTNMVDGPVGGLIVGRSNSGSGAFKGYLDHIRVYGEALGESQIDRVRADQAAGR